LFLRSSKEIITRKGRLFLKNREGKKRGILKGVQKIFLLRTLRN
jgi:hypothetical protein